MGVAKKKNTDSGVKTKKTNKNRGVYRSTQGRSLKSRTFLLKRYVPAGSLKIEL